MKSLLEIIRNIESSGRQFAMRFEPHVFRRTYEGEYNVEIDNARRLNGCSVETARVIVSTSWGWYQIMGFNLYMPGKRCITYAVGEFMSLGGVQESYFEDFCKDRGIFFTDEQLKKEENLRTFARIYNGPGNILEYADRMRKARDS